MISLAREVAVSVENGKEKGTGGGCVGLFHLVEAAAALTQTSSSSEERFSRSNSTVTNSVSDDEENNGQTSTKTTVRRCTTTTTTTNNKEIFPQRLMAILADTSVSDTVCWLPHGRSFFISKPEIFMQEIVPKYLEANNGANNNSTSAPAKYPSFTRKLNRWGFRQVTRGPDTGAFHHSLFLRDEPQLCLSMECKKARKRSVSPRGEDSTTSPKTSPKSSRSSSSTKDTATDNNNDDNNSSSNNKYEALRSLPPKKRRFLGATASLALTATPSKPSGLRCVSSSSSSASGDDDESVDSTSSPPNSPSRKASAISTTTPTATFAFSKNTQQLQNQLQLQQRLQQQLQHQQQNVSIAPVQLQVQQQQRQTKKDSNVHKVLLPKLAASPSVTTRTGTAMILPKIPEKPVTPATGTTPTAATALISSSHPHQSNSSDSILVPSMALPALKLPVPISAIQQQQQHNSCSNMILVPQPPAELAKSMLYKAFMEAVNNNNHKK